METSSITRRSFDVTMLAFVSETSALDAEMLALNAETSPTNRTELPAISTLSFLRLRCWRNSSECNRVTNHGDMGTFSRPHSSILPCQLYHRMSATVL